VKVTAMIDDDNDGDVSDDNDTEEADDKG